VAGDRRKAEELAKQDLSPGQVGYVAPAKAVTGEEFRVKAAVAPSPTGLSKAVQGGRLADFDDPVLEVIPVSLRMRANLDGPGFVVRAAVPAEQMILDDPVATWIWSVKPTLPGRHTLTLTLSPILESGNGKRSVLGPSTFDRKIVVAVAPEPASRSEQPSAETEDSPWSGWSELLVSVASGAILGVGGWLLRRWTRARDTEPTVPQQRREQPRAASDARRSGERRPARRR